MSLKPLSEYARDLKKVLPPGIFAPVPSRLLWLVLHVAIVAGATTIIALGWGGWPIALLLVPVIGHSFAGGAFVAHETLHGSVVRNQWARRLIGWVALVPFCVSPTLWIHWHNRIHHGNTGHAGVDPDAYPTLEQYNASRLIRGFDLVAPGRRRWASAFSLLMGFTVQSGNMLGRGKTLLGLTRAQHAAAIWETLAGVAFWAGIAFLLGPLGFLFAFVLPLLIGNAVVMAYILTNHSLNQLTPINDPLSNSLSVTLPRFFEVLHLDFGFHVEHHLFPAMSARRARLVRDAIVQKWPDRYHSMSLGRALLRLFATVRVYKDEVTLFDPRSGREFPALAAP